MEGTKKDAAPKPAEFEVMQPGLGSHSAELEKAADEAMAKSLEAVYANSDGLQEMSKWEPPQLAVREMVDGSIREGEAGGKDFEASTVESDSYKAFLAISDGLPAAVVSEIQPVAEDETKYEGLNDDIDILSIVRTRQRRKDENKSRVLMIPNQTYVGKVVDSFLEVGMKYEEGGDRVDASPSELLHDYNRKAAHFQNDVLMTSGKPKEKIMAATADVPFYTAVKWMIFGYEVRLSNELELLDKAQETLNKAKKVLKGLKDSPENARKIERCDHAIERIREFREEWIKFCLISTVHRYGQSGLVDFKNYHEDFYQKGYLGLIEIARKGCSNEDITKYFEHRRQEALKSETDDIKRIKDMAPNFIGHIPGLAEGIGSLQSDPLAAMGKDELAKMVAESSWHLWGSAASRVQTNIDELKENMAAVTKSMQEIPARKHGQSGEVAGGAGSEEGL